MLATCLTRASFVLVAVVSSTSLVAAQDADYPPPMDVPAAANDEELEAVISETWGTIFNDKVIQRFDELASVIERTGLARSDPYLQSRGLARRAWADLKQQRWNNGAIRKIDHARRLTDTPPADIQNYTMYAHARAETLLIDAYLKFCYRTRGFDTAERDICDGLTLAWQTEDDCLLCFAHIVAISADIDRDRKVAGFINVKTAEHYALQSGQSTLIQTVRIGEMAVYNLMQLTATEEFKELCRDSLERFPVDSRVWEIAKQNCPTRDETQEASAKYLEAARAGKLPDDFDSDVAFAIIVHMRERDEKALDQLMLVNLMIEHYAANPAPAAGYARLVAESHKARILMSLDKYEEFMAFAPGHFHRLVQRKLYTKAETIVVRSIQVCGRHAPDQADLWWERYRELRVLQNAATIPEATDAAKIAILHDESMREAHRLQRQADLAKDQAVRRSQLADREIAHRMQQLNTSRLTAVLWGTATCFSVLVGLTSVILVRNKTLQTRQKELESEISQRVLAEQRLRDVQGEIVRQQRLHALGEMAAGIAHDINNVLCPIAIYSDLLASDVIRGRDEVRSFSNSISQCVTDATSLIRRLHPFYRKAHSERSEVDVAEVIGAVAENTRRQNAGRNLIVKCETQPGTFRLSAADLREILINLANNAVDAMDGVGELKMKNRITPNVLELEVEDNGSGMSEEVRQRCLDPFFSTKSNGGSGLGLATTMAVVESYNGTIEIESSPGYGTCIRVCIPYSEQSLTKFDKLPWNNHEKTFRILLVDDNQNTLESTQLLLESLGHDVQTCEAEDALELLQQEHFDILLTDYRMHLLNGFDLCKQVREHVPRVATIIMSGYEEPGIREGCDAFLAKPISTNSLKEAIVQSVLCRIEFVS